MEKKYNLNVNLNERQKPTFMDFLKVILFALILGGSLFYLSKNFDSKKTDKINLELINYNERYDLYLSNFKNISSVEKDIVKNNETIFYIKFNGNIAASEVIELREKVDALLLIGDKNQEIIINIESPGGSVTGYGLVASQIERLKQAGFRVTAVIDQVAASGGYMAAVVADKIYAAPFSIVGSVGVVSQVPVFEKLLDNIGIDYKIYTAGESKRTVTSFKSPTQEEEQRFVSKLESIHNQFKSHIKKHRPNVDIDAIATGEFFLGDEALSLNLVDGLKTSDDYLLSKYLEGYNIILLNYNPPKEKGQFLANTLANTFEILFNKINKMEKTIYF